MIEKIDMPRWCPTLNDPRNFEPVRRLLFHLNTTCTPHDGQVWSDRDNKVEKLGDTWCVTARAYIEDGDGDFVTPLPAWKEGLAEAWERAQVQTTNAGMYICVSCFGSGVNRRAPSTTISALFETIACPRCGGTGTGLARDRGAK